MLRRLLIIGADEEELHRLENQLSNLEDVRTRTLRLTDAVNGSLAKIFSETDLAVLSLRDDSRALLEAIASLPESRRPLLLVCTESTTPEATRLLVRIGVADLLPAVPKTEELHAAVLRALRDLVDEPSPDRKTTTISVFSAGDPTSAAFTACTLAHISASAANSSTMLIDLDQIYGPTAPMLGLRPVRGITEALEQLETLDAIAVDGYTMRHDSGLKLFAESAEGSMRKQLDGAKFARLLRLLRTRHDLIVIAANRWLDEASITAAAESQQVLIVLAQRLSDIRNAMRLQSILLGSVGIAESAVRIVVDRYSPQASVRDHMIAKALGGSKPFVLPADDALCQRSIDSGVPPAALDIHAPITRAYIELESQLTGTAIDVGLSPLRRVLASISRSVK